MDFSGAPGDPDDLREQVAAMWVAGASRPEWCFVAEDESGARVGRVGYRVEPTVTNPAWLGTLPPAELFPFGLWLPWVSAADGRVLLGTTLIGGQSSGPADVEASPGHDHPGSGCKLDDIGMDLFQEKEGLTWRTLACRSHRLPAPGRALGRARLLPDVMARGRATLDCNDCWYRDHGLAHWAAR